ncbi:MAG: hypothetical protein K1Y01_07730 [Vicinamibacteria bacterium]|nr:hypothetical protein [Vicinamibacteria bacterium]
MSTCATPGRRLFARSTEERTQLKEDLQMAKTKTDDALVTVRAALAAAKTITQAEDELRAQHGALLYERKSIRAAYASEDEVIANAHRLVDEHAEKWVGTHGTGIVRQLSGHEKHRGDGSSRQVRVVPSLPSFGDLQGALTFHDLCALLPEVMKKRISEVVHLSGARFGLPEKERAAKLAEIDAAIAAVEEQHQAIVAGAADVGITLQQLDAVRERHEAAARQAALDRELAEQRARGEFLVTA